MVNKTYSVKHLLALAEEALQLRGGPSVEEFIGKTGEYLDALEVWQKGMNQDNPLLPGSSVSEAEKQMLRGEIEQLNELHQRLLSQAGAAKDDVGTQMSEVHRRASGLRKYIDSGPSRITIAGKRKG